MIDRWRIPIRFKERNMKKFFYIFFILLLLPQFSMAEDKILPKILLAKTYHSNIKLENYWVSEKLDGVRAYWNGKQLISRQGNMFLAPKWFTEVLPEVSLDGELWLGRGRFSELSGLVRRKSINSDSWKNIRFMVFDLPNSRQIFNERLKQLNEIVHRTNAKHIQLVKQYKIETEKQLQAELESMVRSGGEGLMLHDANSYYKSGRHNDMLKLKKYEDAEAIVIKHLEGKGKYKGLLGAVLVETVNKKRFKIGSGFSDKQRRDPPKIGDVITFKYYGLTKNGIPRFASFMRIREEH